VKKLLSIPNARLYISGQVVSIFGDASMWLAMGIWVKSLTGSSSAAGLVFFAFGLPQLFSPVTGILVDRFRRRPVLIVTNLILGVVVLSLFLVHGKGDVWIIYVVMVLYGLSYNVLGAAGTALLTTLLPEDLLAYGNGALSTAREGLRLVAPLVGAGLFVAVGGGWVAAVDAATFFVAAGTLFLISIDEPRPVPAERHWLDEAMAGARHIFRTTVLRQLTIATVIAVFVVGFSETLIFAIVSQGLHRPPAFLGILLTVQGVGGLIGGLTAATIMRRTGEGVLCGIGLGICACGPPLLAASNLVVVISGLIVFGLGLPWVIVGLTTVFQRMTPSNLQGRTFAAVDVLIGLPQTVSIAIGAGLVAVVDYRLMLLAMGAVMGASCLYLLTRREQWARRLDRHDESDGAAAGSVDQTIVAEPASLVPSSPRRHCDRTRVG
jgi:MFS family permease